MRQIIEEYQTQDQKVLVPLDLTAWHNAAITLDVHPPTILLTTNTPNGMISVRQDFAAGQVKVRWESKRPTVPNGKSNCHIEAILETPDQALKVIHAINTIVNGPKLTEAQEAVCKRLDALTQAIEQGEVDQTPQAITLPTQAEIEAAGAVDSSDKRYRVCFTCGAVFLGDGDRCQVCQLTRA